MKSLEELIALDHVRSKTKVKNAEFISNSKGLYISYLVNDKVQRVGVPVNSKLSTIYQNYITGEMVKMGYFMVTIEGGWLVISPEGEEYQLDEHRCTCYVGLNGLCKHLVFRDGLLNLRRREQQHKAKLIER